MTKAELGAIVQVRCGDSGSPDFLSWCYTKNGEFSVRSAYNLEMERRSGNVWGSSGDMLKSLEAYLGNESSAKTEASCVESGNQ